MANVPPPKNPSASYKPAGTGLGGVLAHILDGKPWFTYWDVERMMRDPWVRFVAKLWCSPFRRAEFTVKANSQEAADWVDASLKFFWAKGLPTLLRRYFCYGFAPAGVEYRVKAGRWQLAAVRPVHPPEARAVECSRTRRLVGFDTGSTPTLFAPYAFWFAGHGEVRAYYDTPPIAGMFDPWLECNGRGGAKHLRQLYARKHAVRPGTMRYPTGEQTFRDSAGNESTRNNQEVGLETAEFVESAANLVLPSDRDEKGNLLWEYIPGEAGTEVSAVGQYPKDLKQEMAEGAGIPYEAIQAAETGSGFAGRRVPYEGWLGTCDELIGLIVDNFDHQVLRPVGRINFGRKADWTVEPVSLVKLEKAQENGGAKPGQPGAEAGAPPGADAGGAGGDAPGGGPAAPGGGGGPGGRVPYTGPRGGRGSRDPVTGHVRYGDMSLAGGDDRPPLSWVGVKLTGAAARLQEKLAGLVAAADLADDGREADPHVTVRYGLHAQDADAVRPAVEGAGPVGLTLAGVGCFPDAETGAGYDVLYLRVESPDLVRLHGELGVLPHTDTHPAYTPHATVAYLKPGRAAKYLERFARLNPVRAVADEVEFSNAAKERACLPLEADGFAMSAAGAADHKEAHALAALAMVALQQEAHAEGDPRKHAEMCHSLAELAKDPDELLRIARGGHPDGSGFSMAFDPGAAPAGSGNPWVKDPGPRSARRWKNTRTGAYRYQDTQPGLHAERRARAVESGERGRELALLASRREATAEHLAELAGHLPAMRAADLRRVRQLLDASFSSATRRDEMARALVDHVRGRPEDLSPGEARPERATEIAAKAEAARKARRKKTRAKAGTLAAAVRSHGGIDPTSAALLAHYSGVKEAAEYGIPLGVFRKGGRGADQIARALADAGHINPGEHEDAVEHLFGQLARGAKDLAADHEAEYDEAYLDYHRREREAREHPDTTPAALAEALRSGEEDARREVEEDPFGEGGESLLGGEAEDAGEVAGGDDFAFGANAPAAGDSPESAPAPLDDENTNVRIDGEGDTTPGPEASHDGELEAVGGGGEGSGLPAGERLGADAEAAPGPDGPGEGEGVDGGGRPGGVPAGPDLVGDGPGGPAGGGGDAAGAGAGDGDGATPAAGVTHGERTNGPRPAAAGAPVVEPQSPAEEVLAGDPTPAAPTDLAAGNWRYDSTDFAAGGLKTKFANNVAAIKTLRAIQAEGRDHATPEEQAVLSRFVGWGQFPAVFNYGDRDWHKEREQLQGLLSSDEWDAARKSTLNAHYTHPDVVKAHWEMAKKLGFGGGRYLETSAGIGYYLGMMPPEVAAKTHATAVELDPTTGGMLGKLYPKANVRVGGFQDHQSPDGFYDLVASNVPFGDYKVHDPAYNRHQANIHDYFFLKSADKVRPGGLVMHITSTGTLDKNDPKIRKALHEKGMDLVSALRFPGGAHKGNAGTDVVTDMLVLRKRLPGEEPGDTSWLETTTVPDPAGGEPIPVNKYFADNPAQVLGTLDRTGSMYRGDAVNVSKTADYEDRLRAAIDRLPANVMARQAAPASRFAPEALPAPGQVKEGGYHAEGGKVYVREGGGMTEVAGLKPAESARLAAHLGVRDALRAVLNAQIAGKDAGPARAELNAAYDAFVKKYGPLNGRANKAAFRSDPDAPVLLALEKYDSDAKTATKADVFHKDTIAPARRVEKAGTVGEAVGVSLHETGGVDIKRIAELTGHAPDAVARHLVASGTAYEDPSHGWQPASHYLSGNVRRKLILARAAAAADPKYAPNVAALEKVQPADVEHHDIEVKLGAPWVPTGDVAAFAAHLLDADPEHFAVNYLPTSGQWMADYTNRGKSLANRDAAAKVWGTDRRGFMDLLEPALNNTPVTVYDKLSDGTSVVNKQATDDANSKIQDIKDAFKNWVWEDDARRERLHRHYNDNFNNVVPLKFDGSHQQLPGKNPAVELRDHQKDFVWRVVTTGTGLAAHEVGTGKTYSMIAAAMELRRLGLAKKPAIACLKANVEAVTADALHLYPGAKILSTADMFDAASRKKTISRIATGDYDMVILTHDHLDLLQMKPDTVEKYIRGELEELEAARAASAAENPKRDNRVVKALEKAKLRLEARLKEALDGSKKDDAVYFEETGIDHLFVDEAHKYKSLPCYTKQDRLKGVPTSRSDKATAMQMRTRWLQENNGGRGVVFATGTPVGNTMAELYNMQRYLQPRELKERGVESFDAWAGTFGDVVTKMEFTATGEYKPVSRFARFTNIPELMSVARQVTDVQRATALKNADGSSTIKRPKRKDEVTTAPKTPAMELLMQELQKRAADLKGKKPGDSPDNMLAICTDGRKGAVDMRMVYASAKDHPESKTNQCVGRVLDLYKQHPGKTQMIFSDIGSNPQANGFHLYKDVIDKLVAGGVPRAEIADFSQLDGAKKDAAVQAMREGKIRVAIGSTQKLGTGVNAQHKLLALHHLDVPWLPSDVEQRDGRGWRHGNENKEVQIHRYVTEGSLDQMFWQIIGNKARFIAQVMTPGQSVGRVAADEDTEELSPDQLMAAASGDPDVMKKVQADEDVKTLTAARVRHDREQEKLKKAARDAERAVPGIEAHAARVKADAAALAENPDFGLLIDGELYEDRKEADAALAKKVGTTRDFGAGTRVASFRGLGLYKVGDNLELRGEAAHATGDTLASVESVARRLAGRAEDAAESARKAREGHEKVKAQIGKAFPKADDLKKAEADAKELEARLKEKANKPKGEPAETPAAPVEAPDAPAEPPPAEPPARQPLDLGGLRTSKIERRLADDERLGKEEAERLKDPAYAAKKAEEASATEDRQKQQYLDGIDAMALPADRKAHHKAALSAAATTQDRAKAHRAALDEMEWAGKSPNSANPTTIALDTPASTSKVPLSPDAATPAAGGGGKKAMTTTASGPDVATISRYTSGRVGFRPGQTVRHDDGKVYTVTAAGTRPDDHGSYTHTAAVRPATEAEAKSHRLEELRSGLRSLSGDSHDDARRDAYDAEIRDLEGRPTRAAEAAARAAEQEEYLRAEIPAILAKPRAEWEIGDLMDLAQGLPAHLPSRSAEAVGKMSDAEIRAALARWLPEAK